MSPVYASLIYSFISSPNTLTRKRFLDGKSGKDSLPVTAKLIGYEVGFMKLVGTVFVSVSLYIPTIHSVFELRLIYT